MKLFSLGQMFVIDKSQSREKEISFLFLFHFVYGAYSGGNL